jgi:hypothetical protein
MRSGYRSEFEGATPLQSCGALNTFLKLHAPAIQARPGISCIEGSIMEAH